MKKVIAGLMAALAVLFVSCESTQVSDKDPAVGKGVNAWNTRGPAAATAYWTEIKETSKQKKYLNYVNLYNAGVAALDSTDGVKASNEAKLLSACNTALAKFNALDPLLKLPASVCEKGAKLTAGRVDNLLAAGRISEANKMYNTAVKVYGKHKAFDTVAKEVDTCNAIAAKRNALFNQASKANEIDNFESKVAAYDAVLAKCSAAEGEVAALVKNSGVGDTNGVSSYAKTFKKVRQDIAIQREGAFREKIYDYKNRIGEEFASQPAGTGSGKNGSFTLDEILAHYQTVGVNMDKIYKELLDFASKHGKDVSQDVIDDVTAQKNDLNSKIAQIKREIANRKEIESRGKTVMPLMIGLFNPAPGSSAESKKSRPAKFSATGVKGNDYWWGMVSIPKGQMNDLVITLKDNRTVRVFNENTKSGKRIEKDGLQDLVSRSSRVGNSWPVLNAGSQLKGTNYYFEVQKGKTENYSGEVVVYSSFITRMR
ncbi:hypothetical protein [Treponema sp.]|uniref:hypothetical protein n=1 Tax=Treponema sp. TaxID=166 RepID=UPI00298DB1F0|nr:hypothetical protein [Treponema sp.]MCR5614082.1 hypothetical protein [Treponema sp.]